MTSCQACDDYLQDNRTRLLPHLGRTVSATGKTPAAIINELLTRYHQLDHPAANTPPHTTSAVGNTTTVAALLRMGKTRRPA